MNLFEFFTHNEVQLPSSWDSHKDFEEFVRHRHDAFIKLIDSLASNPVSDEIQRRKIDVVSCCENIQRALRCSFEGHPNSAYAHFDKAMKSVLGEINALAFDVDGFKDLQILYRVRQTLVPTLKAVDLFHVPFELRHLVGTQRYSIPGLPCLYLAGSLYTCWQEMGRPPLHELQCAALWVKNEKKMKMLNLSNRPARLSLHVTPDGGVPSDPAYISSHVILWPLMFSSSITVKHRNAPFKPEYVIPQMILQWVTLNHGFNGVVYFSTHVDAIPSTSALPACNVVVPARKVTPSGRCDWLCDTFSMTDPYGWQLLSSINLDQEVTGLPLLNFDFEFIKGIKEVYYKTEFGMVQSKLNKLVARILKENNSGDKSAGDVPPH